MEQNRQSRNRLPLWSTDLQYRYKGNSLKKVNLFDIVPNQCDPDVQKMNLDPYFIPYKKLTLNGPLDKCKT